MPFLIILAVFLSLLFLLITHELGHFLIAKKLGVKVEEFGIGYPPKIIGKKIGETVYSINLLPFGAFVRMLGEDGKEKGERSFASKPVWQRMLIVVGGVASFWLIAFLIISLTAAFGGLPQQVSDSYQGKAYVEILQVAKNSPAALSGLKAGDIIFSASLLESDNKAKIDKISELIDYINLAAGKKIKLSIIRGDKMLNFSLAPRKNLPKGQGAMGIAISRISKVKYPILKSFLIGAEITAKKTIELPKESFLALLKYLEGKKNNNVQMLGPIGIGSLMGNALSSSPSNFFIILAIIAIWLAVFNILPIPALDGGKLLFLMIEAIRKKPLSQKTEGAITTFFFAVLLLLMVAVTVNDIIKIF